MDGPRKAMNPRAIAWFVGSAVVLALVILGVSAVSNPPSTSQTAPKTALTSAQKSELAVVEGREALAAGDTTAAVALFEEALRLDPRNEEARSSLDQAKLPDTSTSGSTPPSESAAPPETEVKPDDPVFGTEIKELILLLPATAEGVSLGQPNRSGPDATVSGTPVDPAIKASRVLWTVHDRGSENAADEFLESVSRGLYPKDATSAVIDGAKVYVGTDGTRFATATYVRGRYVFEVVLTSTSGSPRALIAEAKRAAAAFPDGL